MVTKLYPTLDGKVAVLTGAARGIGKAVADALIENNCKVVIGDILEKEGQEVVDAYNEKAGSKVAAFIRTDVTKYSDNIALFKLAETEFGGVDIALMNAGIATGADSMFTPLDGNLELILKKEMAQIIYHLSYNTDATDDRIIDINTTAVIKGTKVALLHMAKRGGGSIVLMASMAGLYCAPNLSSYNASKHAVVGYTRSFQLMPSICNVRVNALCPFWIDTELAAHIRNSDYEKASHAKVISRSRYATMECLVEGFMTLTTDESRNTQTLKVLPDGLEIEPSSVAPDSFSGNADRETLAEFFPAAVAAGKRALAEALARYEQQQ
ncbi:hypothetical protein EDC94DRAFT_690339 [Helicostylum pulchrum]|uniref:Uncharacterized protein n=1 Tax=Helicostylum pulchrum TaxID=562976 RepID=A0ABP9XRP8_9FUNG|nr:hypothetical protein EDC94DRAFT_690339 [Helicostylum pulchrum]